MKESTKQLKAALEHRLDTKVLYVKGVFIVRGGIKFTIPQARKLTGLSGPTRTAKQAVPLYGDYAWIAAINRIKVQ